MAAGARLGLYTCGASAPKGDPNASSWEGFTLHADGTITTPGGLCVTAPQGGGGGKPTNNDSYAGVKDLKEHLASFLLMRGPYAW